MNVKYKDFEFNGSIDELRFAFPFLTGNDCTKAVSEKSVTEDTGKRHRIAPYRGPVVMQVKQKGQTKSSITMMFANQKTAADFLKRPDASSISNSIIHRTWTSSSNRQDGYQYRFYRLPDAVKVFNQIASHLENKSKELSKTNAIVHL